MTLAGAEIGEYMESMEMRPALPESNGFPAAAANSWYSPPGSAGEKVAYGYDTLSDHAEKHVGCTRRTVQRLDHGEIGIARRGKPQLAAHCVPQVGARIARETSSARRKSSTDGPHQGPP